MLLYKNTPQIWIPLQNEVCHYSASSSGSMRSNSTDLPLKCGLFNCAKGISHREACIHPYRDSLHTFIERFPARIKLRSIRVGTSVCSTWLCYNTFVWLMHLSMFREGFRSPRFTDSQCLNFHDCCEASRNN